MSDAPYGGPPPASGGGTPHPRDVSPVQAGPTYGATPWPTQSFTPTRPPSRLPLILVSLLALVSLGIAVASWFRPTPSVESTSSAPQYSDEEIAEATASICSAWDKVFKALITSGYQTSEDPTVNQIFGVQMKIALHASGDYLHAQLLRSQAADSRLLAATERLADSYHQAVLSQLSGAPESEIEAIKSDIREAEGAIKQECE
jgi:hypothetical protein